MEALLIFNKQTLRTEFNFWLLNSTYAIDLSKKDSIEEFLTMKMNLRQNFIFITPKFLKEKNLKA